MGTPELWPHQRQTVDFAVASNVVYDTSDPGTGKTRAHLEAFARHFDLSLSRKALVVCPKTLMRPAWGNDASAYIPLFGISFAYAENRERAFAQEAAIYVVNTDGVKWLAKQKPAWLKQTFGEDPTLIIDESTAYKHHTSDRSKAIRAIAPYFKYRRLLTGTPITSSVTDLWHQLFLLDGGKRLGKSFFAFRNSVQMAIPQGNFMRWVDKPGMEDTLSLLIKDITIRHQFDEVMDVPENYARSIKFDLSPRALSMYQDLARQSVLELEAGDVSAVNAAVLRGKLLQVASGAVYGDRPGYHLIDPGRYELIVDLIEERKYPVVVFFNWKHQRDELCKLLSTRKLSHEVVDGHIPNARRAEIVARFQAEELRALLLHPQTGAHGLTLTAGRTIIWASPRDEPDFLKQGLHRIYRGGQKHKTETLYIEANDTVEPGVYARAMGKYDRMVSMLDLLKESSHA